MLLPSPAVSGVPEKLDHLTTLTHEGKVLVFAVSQAANIYYTVRRDGFEDRSTTAPAQLDNWENWKPLPFLEENGDQSVIDNEMANLSVTVAPTDTAPDWVSSAPPSIPPGPVLIYRSLYAGTLPLTSAAPVQAISALGCVYTFRQSTRQTVLVDRYVLDGLANNLIRKLDVRYRRSRQRLAPLPPEQASSQGVIDGLDYRDANGLPFYEPAIELNFLAGVSAGNFAVVFAETVQPDENYWHFFLSKNPAAGKIDIVSVPVSKEGLFNVNDPTGGSGIQRRSLLLQDSTPAAVALTGAPVATRYDKQKQGTTRDGQPQLLRDSVHTMLALPTASGIVAVSIAVIGDGTLAQISAASPVTSVNIHSSTQVITLPPTTLQEITALDPAATPAFGTITAITAGADGTAILTLQTAAGSPPIPANGTIRIDGSGAYNGNYSAAPVSLGAISQALLRTDVTVNLSTALAQPMETGSRIRFNVPVVGGLFPAGPFVVQLTQAAPVGATSLTISSSPAPAIVGTTVSALDLLDVGPGALGTWTQVGAPVKAQASAGGRKIDLVALAGGSLRINSPGVNVGNGESVEIDGAQVLDGVHSFQSTPSGAVQLTDPWQGGNLLELQTVSRIGLQFGGAGDFIRVAPGAFSLSGSFTIEAWVQTTSTDCVLFSIAGTDSSQSPPALVQKLLFLAGGKLGFSPGPTPGTTRSVADGNFHHVAVTFDGAHLAFYVDGQQDSIVAATNVADVAGSEILFGLARAFTPNPSFSGTLAELRVWETAHSVRDIANFMNVSLTGREESLAGYWRLTSIVEDEPRTVTDFTPRANHGVVNGNPFVSDAVLSRDLGNGRKASGFVSVQFFNAVAGATYEESFQFQLDDGTQPAPSPPFDFDLFGKTGADSAQTQPIAELVGQPQFSTFVPGTFSTVTCRFVVPDGISLVRAFGIQNVQGNWTALHVRNHRVGLFASSITDSLIQETIAVPASTLQAQQAAQLRSNYEGLEISEQLLQVDQAHANDLIERANNLFAQLANPLNYWCQIRSVTGGQPNGSLTISDPRPSGGRFLINQIPPSTTDNLLALVRFQQVQADGQTLVPDNPLSAPPANCAIVSAASASAGEVHGLFGGVLGSQLADAERPPLTLDSSSAGATPFLEPSTLSARLSPTHLAAFNTQQAEDPSTTSLVIAPSQLWKLANISPQGQLAADSSGQADLSRPFTWTCSIGTPGSEPGSHTFLTPAQVPQTVPTDPAAQFIVGLESSLALSVPSFDLTPFTAGELPKAGRPVSETTRSQLAQILVSLNSLLTELHGLGFSGVTPASGTPAQRLATVQANLAAAAQAYLAQRSGTAGSVNEHLLTPPGAPRVSVTSLGPAPSTQCRLHLIDSADGQVELTFLESENLTLQSTGGTSTQENLEFRQLIFDTTVQIGPWSLKPLPACLNLQGFLEIQNGPALSGDWSAECWLFVPNNPSSLPCLQLSGPQGGSVALPAFQVVSAAPAGTANTPAIASISQQSSQRGATLTGVVITGAATHFTQASPVVTFSRKGVTATALQVTDDTHLTVTLNVDPNAEPGASDVSVSTGAETAIGAGLFTVIPALASVTPASGPRGQTVSVAIVGIQTHFVDGTTTVSFRVPGLTVSSVHAVDLTHLTLNVAIAATVPVGPVDVTVVTSLEAVTGSAYFEVASSAAPTIAGMNPANGQRGQVLSNVLITGTSTHFTLSSPSVSFAGAGIVASAVQVFDDTHLAATLTIASDADIGPNVVTVSTGSERATGLFTVSFIAIGWHHFAVVSSAAAPGQTTFYLDGVSVGGAPLAINGQLTQIGPAGKLAEVRIWSSALSQEEVDANYIAGISGHEPGLAAYYPLDGTLNNLAAGQPANNLAVAHAVDLTADLLPFPAGMGRLRDATEIRPVTAISAEYVTYAVDPASGNNTSWLRRFFACPGDNGTYLFAQKRVEELELVWIGNAQYAPTLLGYIEGAPPVPSENLTVNPDSYAGATSVTLSQSEEVDYSWTQSKESKYGTDADFFLGVETEVLEGAAALEFVGVKALSFKLGAKGSLALSRSDTADSTVSTSVTISSTDHIELRGHVESAPAFPDLGVRFLPKNVGYALVVSTLADVFITRLSQTQRMISYTVLPTPDVPPQINTITFLIDPAYTLNGTLDGQVGTHAADDAFYQTVPEMRARQGALFPASYLRLSEAIDLQRQIDQQDKQRESFFTNFDTSLAFGLGDQDALVAAQIDLPGADSVPVGVPSPAAASSAPPSQQQAQLDQINTKLDGISTDLTNQQSQQDQLIQSKKDQIQQSIQDPQAQVHALRSFAAWQQKMEDLLVKAGKHNIVNSYVWDANGGFRADTQQFASTIEHSVGSSVSYDASLGISLELGVGIVKTELNAAANIGMTQTLTKTATSTNVLSLDVEASGVEGLGITDENDVPLTPGEKVERYRFLTFYLEPSTQNFNDFFNTVVDPDWLASNDEDALALRQTQAGKPNATWRVLHRVTFIERPALAGFGKDLRPVASNAAPVFSLEQAVMDLQQENQALNAKLDQILALLRPGAAAAGG